MYMTAGLNVKNKSNFCSTYMHLGKCQFENFAKYAFWQVPIWLFS